MEFGSAAINSPLFSTQAFQKQIDIITKASEVAQKKIDYASAHNDEIVRAIEIVEDFLRDKHRLCYGGQAINAHLPAKYKFYDPEYSIPDYDFFTPDQESDITYLVKQLRKAGFIEISAREGMHEGTTKIYVNYTPIADITQIDKNLYKLLSKREYRYQGISYLDANTLRMLMYLELSRPRGEVGRWPKVFERLALFNEFVPVISCKAVKGSKTTSMTEDESKYVMSLIINKQRIFAGADLVGYYGKSLQRAKVSGKWLLNTKKPIIFYSENPEEDISNIISEFGFLSGNRGKITHKRLASRGVDLIPPIQVIFRDNIPIIIIVEQTACHSYLNIPVEKRKILRIATIDTLITLYFGLGLIDEKYMDMGSLECLANELVQISTKARLNPKSFPFPFISLKCSGYQTSMSSLIRAKVKRITEKRRKIEGLLNMPSNRTTAKRKR